MKRLPFLFFFPLLFSCAHMQAKWEARKYHDTKEILQSAIPYEILDRCGFDLNAPMPLVQSSKEATKGTFYPTLNAIIYPKNHLNLLVHEYAHAMVENGIKGPISMECRDEAIASLTAYADRLRKENSRLKKELYSGH